MVAPPSFEEQFPEPHLFRLFSQMSSWTTVDSVLAAAKILNENSAVPQTIFLTFPDDDNLQNFLINIIDRAIKCYRCPDEHLRLAQALEPAISVALLQRLADARFQPNISVAGTEYVKAKMPWLPDPTMRAFVVNDQPAIIELIFEPLHLLHRCALQSWEQASSFHRILHVEPPTRGRPSHFHRHYADGALRATVDALAYYCFGFDIGVRWNEGKTDVEPGFRCVNIVGAPPFPEKLVNVARELYISMAQTITEE